MKKMLLALSLLILTQTAQAKPFRRVVVLAGGGMQVASNLGVIAGLKQAGWNPDLIMTTCGASIAGAILNSHAGNIGSAHEFLLSDDYIRFLHGVTVREDFLPQVAANLFLFSAPGWVPPIFTDYVLRVPQQWPANNKDQSLIMPFQAKAWSTPVIMVAARVFFGPEHVGAAIPGRKLFRETFFTDAATAQYLRPITQSAIAAQFPNSRVTHEIEIRADFNLFNAARASISDPYLMHPMMLNGETFLTGGVDLYPLEVADRLGDQVIVIYGTPYGAFDERAIQNTFGFDAEKRYEAVLKYPVYKWIDFSDSDNFDEKNGFDPQIEFLNVAGSVPKAAADVDRQTELQWDYGRNRAVEAIMQPINSQAHIRIKTIPSK